MPGNNQPLEGFSLEPAINRHPLIMHDSQLVSEAITLMSQTGQDCVLVVENQQLVGLLTEADIIKLTADQIPLAGVALTSVMQRDPVTLCVSQAQDTSSILSLWQQHRISHLPIVTRDNRLVGVLTPKSFLESVLDTLSRQQLENQSLLPTAQSTQNQLSCMRLPEFQAILNAMTDAVVFADCNRRIQILNPAAIRIFGYQSEELLGQPTAILYTSEEEYERQEPILFHLDAEELLQPYEVNYRRANGEVFVGETVGTVVKDNTGTNIGLLSIIRDLSQRKLTEETLRNSQYLLQKIAETTPNFVYIFDLVERKNIYTNRELAAVMGYTAEEIRENGGCLFIELFHPEDILLLGEHYQRIAGSRETEIFEIEYRVRHANGEWRSLHSWDTVFSRNAQGLPTQILGTSLDITEKKQAEKALEKSQSRLAGILNIAEDAIISVDGRQIITLFNQGAEKLFGYSCPEVLGQSLDLLLPSHFADIDRRDIQEFGQSSEITRRIGQRKEVFGVCKDGREFPAESSISKLELEDEVCFTVILRDITERKQTEKLLADYNHTLEERVAERTRALSQALEQLQATQAQLVEAEKMAALASLVAGVAHEINTPLGIGVTASSTLAEKTAEFSQIYHSGAMKRSQLTKFLQTTQQTSDIILSNLNRAAELIKSFKQVAVDQCSESRRSFKLKEYLQETLTALRPKFKGSKHTVEIQGDESIILDSYPGVLSQIVTNLVINSLIHAYSREDRGLIAIDFQTACSFYGQGEEIILSYTDDGQGIPPEIKKKIFDPFFTTKRGQGGSGLGLHLVYNLVSQKLHGTIECQTQVGIGTKFTIRFPAQISYQY